MANKTLDMTSGVIWRQLVTFSLPVAVGFLFQQLYSTVDSLVVGNYVGSDALGAISGTMVVTWAFVSLLMGFSGGAGVVVSQDFGARDWDALRRSTHTAVAGSSVLSIAFAVLGWALTPAMLGFMNLDARLMDDAIIYLRIYCLGIPGLLLYDIGTGILRAVGDSRRPLYILIVSSLLNVALDILFVVCFGWEVAGAGRATVISLYISAAIVLILLFRTDDVYGLRIAHMCIDRFKLRRILSIGLPSGVQMGIISLSNVFVQGYVNAFGAEATTAWGIYFRIDGFVVIPGQALCMAITTFVGQNAGAHNLPRIRQGTRTCMAMMLGVCIVLSIVAAVTAPWTVPLFSTEELTVEYAVLFLQTNTVLNFVGVPNSVDECSLQGVGDTKVPMLIAIGSYVVFRQLFLLVATRVWDSILVVSISFPLGWLLCSVLMPIYYRRSKSFERVAG